MKRRGVRPDWAKYQAQLHRQRVFQRDGKPNPSRITAALDARDLYGPEVDLACGVEEPAVDEWEAGTRVPTEEQVEALSRLTGYSVEFFYRTDMPRVSIGYACGPDGCHVIDDRPSAPVVQLHPETLF